MGRHAVSPVSFLLHSTAPTKGNLATFPVGGVALRLSIHLLPPNAQAQALRNLFDKLNKASPAELAAQTIF